MKQRDATSNKTNNSNAMTGHKQKACFSLTTTLTNFKGKEDPGKNFSELVFAGQHP